MARSGKFPVVLSSATPSIESLVNVESGTLPPRRLAERYRRAAPPRHRRSTCGRARRSAARWLSPPLVRSGGRTLDRGDQALLFLNRRGYAPVTLCRKCGFKFECPNCSAWLVEHRFRKRLECHHCGTFAPTSRNLSQMRRRAFARAVRTGRRAHRRGGGGALSARRAARVVERPRRGA